MTVTLVAPIGINPTISADPFGDVSYRLDVNTASYSLERHPRCGVLAPDRSPGETFGRLRTWSDWPDPGIYDYYQPSGNHWTYGDYNALRERGFDSFSLHCPVIQRTLRYFRTPNGVGSGLLELQSPPVDAPIPVAPEWLGGPWYWQLTADTLNQEGRELVRNTDWTALPFSDAAASTLLY